MAHVPTDDVQPASEARSSARGRRCACRSRDRAATGTCGRHTRPTASRRRTDSGRRPGLSRGELFGLARRAPTDESGRPGSRVASVSSADATGRAATGERASEGFAAAERARWPAWPDAARRVQYRLCSSAVLPPTPSQILRATSVASSAIDRSCGSVQIGLDEPRGDERRGRLPVDDELRADRRLVSAVVESRPGAARSRESRRSAHRLPGTPTKRAGLRRPDSRERRC